VAEGGTALTPKARTDAILQVIRAFYLAFPLGMLAYIGQRGGWAAAAWFALPLFSVYQAGRMASLDQEMREFEERLRRLSEKIGADGDDDS
jgi:hypothetical protein